ncbi:MAG TPA: FecR domain-containing protein [Puia sp.]|nr:FecR domain-containing protein [Puia sp.]
MPASRLSFLFYRYFDNIASDEERDELMELLAREENETRIQELMEEAWETFSHDSHRIPEARGLELLEAVLSGTRPADRVPGRRIMFRTRFMALTGVAAAVILVTVAGIRWWGGSAGSLTGKTVAHERSSAVRTAGYTRQYRLPDGTTVILRAGGRLDFPSIFGNGSREVSLTGEAYFDVASDARRPFIIHTGGISTTVLGTAFNISASTERVVVSVTQGKVKVEEGARLLAVLEPDHQVSYSIPSGEAEKRQIDAHAVVTDWTRQDMAFEQSTFAEIAAVLSRRYGIVVEFKNPRLRSCKIKAYFNGTESLAKVLDLLCTISNAQYTREGDGRIVIDGPGCS